MGRGGFSGGGGSRGGGVFGGSRGGGIFGGNSGGRGGGGIFGGSSGGGRSGGGGGVFGSGLGGIFGGGGGRSGPFGGDDHGPSFGGHDNNPFPGGGGIGPVGGGGGFFRGGGPSFGGMRPAGGPPGGVPGSAPGIGCSAPVVVILVGLILVLLIFGAVFSSAFGGTGSGSGDTEIKKSTVTRVALPRGSVNETGYYTDKLDWIKNSSELTSGMRYFYQKTGVQPYLYITDTVNGSHAVPSHNDLAAYANSLYDELFTDEAHLLVLFFEYDNEYEYTYICGSAAKTVTDTEAVTILFDYIERYYHSSLSEDAFFSKSFSDAADRIMTVTKSPWITVWIVLGAVAIVAILLVWWRMAKKQKNMEARQTEEILKTPLEKFGDEGEAENLAKKYEDDNTQPK